MMKISFCKFCLFGSTLFHNLVTSHFFSYKPSETFCQVARQISSSRDPKQVLDFLVKEHNFKPELIDTLYDFAKFQFECGNYSGARSENFSSCWGNTAF